MNIETKDCRHGKLSYLPHDRFIGRSLQTYGEYSEYEVMFFKLVLRPGDIALDVGANIGVLTVPMAQAVGALGAIHAFEPQREIHELLRTNLAQNGLTQVTPHRSAVGAAAGSIRVPPRDYDDAENFGGVALGGDQGEEVPVVTVDSLQLPRLRLMKIDVEGMEIDVLKGARDTIRLCEPAIYVENDRRENSQRLIGDLFALGYRLWWYVTPLFNPDNFFHAADDIFGIWSINMVGFPRAAPITLPFAEVSGPDDMPRTAKGDAIPF